MLPRSRNISQPDESGALRISEGRSNKTPPVQPIRRPNCSFRWQAIAVVRLRVREPRKRVRHMGAHHPDSSKGALSRSPSVILGLDSTGCLDPGRCSELDVDRVEMLVIGARWCPPTVCESGRHVRAPFGRSGCPPFQFRLGARGAHESQRRL